MAMQKNRQIVLQNPFHPLDLSPHDLLAIYKRFQQSRLINRNPKQQLPIETIAQLISSLKGCTPSYIQRCISQALIKETISWNEFLTFLDQESEVREKILEWLMYEKSTVKYREEREWPFRAKISKFYEEITFLKFVDLTDNEKVIICSIDKLEYYLFSEANGRITIIDKYINKSEKPLQDKPPRPEEEHLSNPSILNINNSSKVKKATAVQASKSLHRHDRSERDRVISSMINSSSKGTELTLSRDEEEGFYRKERKNINSLFNVFKDLSLDNSLTYAKLVSQKLSEKNMNPAQINLLRDTFSGLQDDRTLTDKKLPHGPSTVKPLDKAKTILRQLHQQKRVLSYNPYSAPKRDDFVEVESSKTGKGVRRATKERKEPQYNHLANHEAYNAKLRCLAIVYFNMELVLVKLQREYNKISLEYQDKLRIFTENEHKKNEVIEGVDFYYHSIVNKWFLIVLIRVEYKNEARNENESYIRGYEIELVDRKARLDKGYRFKNKKETFSLPIAHPAHPQDAHLVKHEVFNMEMQLEYGIHFISVSGRYVCFREDYVEGKARHDEGQFFTFHHEERFKNAGLSLSCLAVGLELNKIVFGTIRGIIIIYDMFSHLFKVKKVAAAQISQIRVVGSTAYVLSLDEKLIVFDLVKAEEIQHLNVRNESKLHEKVKRFELSRNVLYFYGTEVRSYTQYVDERLLHERRKMQTIYKWRLDKLFREEASFKKEKRQARELKSLLPANAVGREGTLSIEAVVQSESYFLVLTEILELVVVEKKSLRIKFTMILDVPHDSKVMRMAISGNEKLLALLLFNQNIYVFNIHTQDLYQTLRPAPYLKYTSLCFLDSKNEFLLASGTENGKIILSPYTAIPEKNPKVLEFHRKAITALVIAKREYLVSCGEDLLITIWLLPFNILKHEIKLHPDVGYVSEEVGCFKELAYLRTVEGHIAEVNTHEGKLVRTLREYQGWTCCTVDSCTGQLLGINSNSNLEILVKGKQGWTLKTRVTIEQLKQEIKALGVVESEKAVIFLDSGMILPWSFQSEKLGKGVNLCQQ